MSNSSKISNGCIKVELSNEVYLLLENMGINYDCATSIKIEKKGIVKYLGFILHNAKIIHNYYANNKYIIFYKKDELKITIEKIFNIETFSFLDLCNCNLNEFTNMIN